MKDELRIGLIGTGWAGETHAKAFRRVHGVRCILHTVCSLDPTLKEFSEKHGFLYHTSSSQDLFDNDEIDIIDIASPPASHADLIRLAIRSGKHVICEKPISGIFMDQDSALSKLTMSKVDGLARELHDIETILNESQVKLCYAENWIYSPSFMKAIELIMLKKSPILCLEASTGHRGSHAAHAPYWKFNGGGSLIRQGTHPIAAALYAKRKITSAMKQPYGVKSILGSVAVFNKQDTSYPHLKLIPHDVEDWSHVVITFIDGSKATITASDILLGGILNTITFHGPDFSINCNMTPNNQVETYFADDINIQNIKILEGSSSNIGRQYALVDDIDVRGYVGEMQNFAEHIAMGTPLESDFVLAKETLEVIYAAYISASTGREILYSELNWCQAPICEKSPPSLDE